EHTVVRPRAQAEAAPEPAPAPAARRRLWPLLAGTGVLVVGCLVAAAVVFAPTDTDAGPTPAPSASSDIITLGVPSPAAVAVTPSADGTQVTFEWENPEPQDGDRFLWNRSDGPNEGAKTPTESGSTTIGGVDSNTQVCVEVVIVRTTGKLSTEPLEMCSK
ncbi:MAG: hypothetical protein ABWX76_13785, partial [Leifsonia flava]